MVSSVIITLHTVNQAPPSRRNSYKTQQVTVFPASIDNHKYQVSMERAEVLVARGMATWIPGTRTLRERTLKPRGEMREWRKTPCRDERGTVIAHTMQFVVPDDLRVTRSLSTTNHRSNRKRVRMSPQSHPPAPSR